MPKILLSLLFFVCLSSEAFNQCNNPPPAQCPCQTDVICGFDALDDYCLNMASFATPFGNFPGCSGNVLNNPNWFSFVAGASSLSLTITPTNCQSTGMNQGIQAAIYEASSVVPDANCNSCDPSSLFSAADAIGTQCGCTTSAINFNNLATTPGFTYYVVIDGCGGDVCDVAVDILMGGDPPTVDDPGDVLLPPVGFNGDTVCPGAVDYNITLDQVDGAGYYSWLLPDGSHTETFDPELLYTFPGGAASWGQSFDFCVRAANDCGASNDSTCFTIVVAPLDTIFDPDITLCEGSTTSWRGITIGPYNGLTMNRVEFETTMQTDPALYQCEYIAAVDVHVINENDENPTVVDTVVCEGESVTIFGNTFSGDYTNETVQGLTALGCDTFAELTMVTLNASAVYNTTPPVECSYPGMFRFGASQLTLEPSPNDPNTNVVFNWYRPGAATPFFTANNEFLLININDFQMEVETFELYITMTYDGRPGPDGCTFGPFTLVVDLKQYIPSTPVINGPDTLCVGNTAVFTATELFPAFVNPDAYLWDVSDFASTNVIDQFQNTYTVQFNSVGSGMLCLTVRNTCFLADTCKVIHIISGPNAGPDAFACDDEYMFNAQSIGGGSIWSVVTKPSASAMATFDDNTDPMTSVSVNEFGVYQFAWGPDPSCTDDVFITFLDSIRMVGAENYFCDNTNTTYTIQFQVQGGLPPYSVPTGNGTMTGSVFNSDPILSNDGFTVTIRDAAGCQSTFDFNPHECSCDTEGGTMSAVLLESCGDACHQAISNLDTMMDGNDVAEYIIHDQPGASIANVLGRNTTGEFCFNAAVLSFDVTYYISLVVGDDLGGGLVNLNEGCTRVAPGQPVIWHEIPVASATTGLSQCSDTIGLTATPSVGTGTWSYASGPGTVTFDNVNSPTPSASVSQCGSYELLWIEDNSGCRDTARVSVDFLCRPEVASFSTPCNGTQTAINLTINLQNGQAPYTEDFGRGTINASVFTIDDLPLNMADTFYFTDANGCQLTVPVDIGDCECVSDPGSMSLIPVSDCQDQMLTFTHDNTNVVADANDRLRFIVHTLSDTTLGTIIAASDSPEFTFSDGPFVCDSTYYVSAVMGNWTGTTTDLSDPCLNVSPGQPLRFDCQVIVDAGVDFSTCMSNLNISGTSSSGSGIWTAISSGATISRVDNLTGNVMISGGPGQYTFEFSSSNGGCSASDQITLTVPDGPTIDDASVTISCNSDNDMYTVSFNFSGGTGPYVVMGNLGTVTGNSFTSDPIPSGTSYSFELLDANDCSRDMITDTYICPCVTEVGVMAATDANLCEDETFDASAFYDGNDVTDGNDVINYILSSSQSDPTSDILAANTSGNFNFNDAVLTFGTTYYIAVIIGDESSPSNVDLSDRCLQVSGVVSVAWYNRIDVFDIAATATEITCQDPQISLSVMTSEDITGYEINWTTSDGNIEPGDENMDPARINSRGTYTLTISHPIAGCAESRDIVITQADDVPVVTILEPMLLTCDRNEVTISGEGSTTGPSMTYEWNGPGIVGANTGIDIQANTIGVYTLTVRNMANGCEITGNVTLREDRVDPTAVANALSKIDCDSDQVTVSGVGSLEGSNVIYSWTIVSDTGNIVGSTDQRDIIANVPGIYELTVLNLDNGCSSVVRATVEQEGNIINSFETEVNPSGCAGVDDGSISVVNINGGVGPFTYSFDGGLTYSPNATQGQFGPGVYSVIVRDNNGCELVDSAILPAPFDFFVDLGADQIVLLGDEVVLTAETNLPDSLRRSIRWSQLYDTLAANELEQIFTPELGQYSISIAIANDNGCIQEDIVNVFVRFEERVYIPTAMNPKSTATDNRYLNIYADPSSVAAIKSFDVYDRWGKRLFQRTDVPVQLDLNALYAWDGTDKGEDVLPGVYTYVVHLEYVTGVTEVISGGVTLLR